MGERTVEIKDIKPDMDNTKQCTLLNPLDEDFTFKLDGKPFVVPSKKHLYCTEPVANHGALHLAKRIVKENRGQALVELLKEVKDPDHLKYRKLLEKSYSQKDTALITKALVLDNIVNENEVEEKIDEVEDLKKNNVKADKKEAELTPEENSAAEKAKEAREAEENEELEIEEVEVAKKVVGKVKTKKVDKKKK